jgi:hypothetical protein
MRPVNSTATMTDRPELALCTATDWFFQSVLFPRYAICCFAVP